MTLTASMIFHKPRVIHGDDRKLGLTMALCAALTIAWIDSLDNANEWRKEAERAQAQVAHRNALESLPNPTIILDARTAEEFGLKLADVAGGADGLRAELRRGK